MAAGDGLDIGGVAAGRYVLLTTFTKDGVAKPTPMGFVAEGDELLLTTSANTWKVTRIRRNPKVTVAVCTQSGRVISPTSDATAAIVEDPASVARIRAAVVKRYGLPSRIVTAWLDRRNGARVGISVTLGAPELC
ncbi:PPOX class F420-dependent oxidoreductase [Mycobacterium sp. CBMA271]|uniref:PPOX class F420-dependent oxidoreductase n=1 Tax=unclassified Mycobacteroides TaxID=2618759 RepID=UPI0012DEC32B|nr:MULTISPECIES: PPOX class F420-dependent oxidoreductase [unclassified Mycobacteroides]MUM18796.1 PPOX class F420-dependent enzyme [Mycobacteroides sp. CBMA 326]MUM22759.1 PPOX class F420-dependent oxidoreductase [Mycobacteroides sp. CBMA 271]